MPSRLTHLHLDKNVARKEFTLALALLPVAHLHHFFGGDEDLAELIFNAGQPDTLDQRAHDMLLVTRVSMHHVLSLSHGAPLPSDQRNNPTYQRIKPPQQQRHH